MKNLKARFVAFRVGIFLEQVDEGFYLFSASTGHQLGYDFNEPWLADEVIDYCGKLKACIQKEAFNI